MISQIGSLPRAARSALEAGRSATGIFRSAILTYFGQIVIQEPAATKGSCAPALPSPAYGGGWGMEERIAPEAQARSHGAGRNIPGVGSRRKRVRAPPAAGGPAEPESRGGNAMAVPFDQRPDLIWFDGKLVPTADAKISVLTHGLHYASCVFEGERAYGGVIFKCT